MSVSIAVIGAGYWGPNLIRNFASLPECVLAAVCDLDPARLAIVAEEHSDVHTTTQLEEVLADPEIDAVAIATPAESHREVAEGCLQAGKHLYVEKPLATKSADAEAIVRLAQEKARILMVGHLFLYDPAIMALTKVVEEGVVGQVRYVHSVRTSMSGTARLDTSIVWDALIHDIYVLCEVLQRAPTRVMATGGAYLSPGLEDVVFATFDFGQQVLAQCYVSWYALQKARTMTVVGSDAILVYDDLANPRLARYARRYAQSDELDPQGRPRWSWVDEGVEEIRTDATEPLRLECEHFIQCVEKLEHPRTDGLHALQTIRIGEAFEHSLLGGGCWEVIG